MTFQVAYTLGMLPLSSVVLVPATLTPGLPPLLLLSELPGNSLQDKMAPLPARDSDFIPLGSAPTPQWTEF